MQKTYSTKELANIDGVSMRVLMVVSGVLLLVMATGVLIDRKFYSKGMMRDADPEEQTN